MNNKPSLRKQLRAARRGLDLDAQRQAADGLLQQVLGFSDFMQSDRVAVYLANDGEIDSSAVIAWMQDNHRHCYLPVVRQEGGRNSLLFAEIKKGTQLIDNQFGIAEPLVDEAELIAATELDLVLLPLVGFDDAGNRVGMGGGFYDTTFEFLKESGAERPVLAGIAHELQKVKRIDAERWDIPLKTVITDRQIYRFG